MSFLTLAALEIVLGIDNIIFLALLVDRLPPAQRRSARLLGLSFAMLTRIALLFSITWLATLRAPLFAVFGQPISGRSLVLFAGFWSSRASWRPATCSRARFPAASRV